MEEWPGIPVQLCQPKRHASLTDGQEQSALIAQAMLPLADSIACEA